MLSGLPDPPAIDVMDLYLIRHPPPREAPGMCYGRRDVAVRAASVWRAAAVARAQIPPTVLRGAFVHTSPLSRCARLARALATRGVPLIDRDLIEMSFGAWEGHAWDALPRAELDAWSADLWNYRPGGGENAREVAERLRRFVRRQQRTRRAAVVAVTHAGVIRVALALAGRRPLSELTAAPIAFGSVHRLADHAVRR